MRLKLLGLAVIISSLGTPAFAQSATGTGSITVVRPLTVTRNADLRFGTVVRPSTGAGTTVIDAGGARSVTGGVVALSSGDLPQAAQFTIAGEGAQSVSVTVPATFSIANQTETLTVTTTNSLTGSAATQALSGAIGAAGSLVVNVGGSVPITSTTPTGLYTGTFTVSAAYN
jgi:microcystin-dependent protein